MDKTIWKNYLSSFQFKPLIRPLLMDSFFVVLCYLIFSWFGNYLKSKAEQLDLSLAAQKLEELLTSSPDQAQLLAGQLQSFVLTVLLGFGVILLFLFLFYSYTRKVIWSKNYSITKYWKWNAANLVLLLLLVPYLAAYFVVKIILYALFKNLISGGILIFVNGVIDGIFLLFFLIFLFLLYYSFQHKYMVWNSVGQAFQHFKKLNGLSLLLILITFIALNLLLGLFNYWLQYQPAIAVILNVGLFLVFISWLRNYVSTKFLG
ncbi:MAG TPA: hypothetical protein VJC39_02175 [Candidatus Nanoarchaeia archaeon]|nr:hypothetical protein [Candidatus Nanoarchaeia archaeon]